MIEHKFYKFPSIEQFRHQFKALKDFIYFNGLVDDEPTFDYTRTLPTVAVNCTEKIHGTYAGVVYADNQLYAQSRNKVLAIGDDNAGFALFVEQHKTLLTNICIVLKSVHNLSDSDVIVLSGEWAGGSIQKNSALSGVDKKFLIFPQFRVIHADESTSTLPIFELHLSSDSIYSLANFPEATFATTIDFESELSINSFLELMESRIAAIEESYLKFVTTDTLKEENDLIVASGFEVKQIMSRVNDRAKKYFLELIKK